ncbi:MAG: cobyrinate a,c-diamide synthase [Lachnospiraceae bacterium]
MNELMSKSLPRIMFAAPQSGSGKTLITCGFLQALLNQQLSLVAFKCGPDYIDPMFHQSVLGIPSKNVDTFFADKDTVCQLMADGAEERDLAVVEGVMGLYDGLAGTKEEASSYHVAEVTQTPIILVINARGMGRSLLPLIAGFLQYDHAHLICGVILNKTSKMFCQLIGAEIERELGVKVLGYVPVLEEVHLESRHLGLWLPNEIAGLKEQLNQAAKHLTESLDIPEILKIAKAAKPLQWEQKIFISAKAGRKVNIAIAQDEAFCFYYEDNLRLLRQAGANLVPFSPLHDKILPQHTQGILLGGGYPELYLKQLSQNESMKQQIFEAIQSGVPSVAECGGFLYLHEQIEDVNGNAYNMVGAISGRAIYENKLVRFGYCTVMAEQESFLKKEEAIRAHEFHYYDSTVNGKDCRAQKPITQRSWQCVHANSSHWWGFPHLYYLSNPKFAERFVETARQI